MSSEKAEQQVECVEVNLEYSFPQKDAELSYKVVTSRRGTQVDLIKA